MWIVKQGPHDFFRVLPPLNCQRLENDMELLTLEK